MMQEIVVETRDNSVLRYISFDNIYPDINVKLNKKKKYCISICCRCINIE